MFVSSINQTIDSEHVSDARMILSKQKNFRKREKGGRTEEDNGYSFIFSRHVAVTSDLTKSAAWMLSCVCCMNSLFQGCHQTDYINQKASPLFLCFFYILTHLLLPWKPFKEPFIISNLLYNLSYLQYKKTHASVSHSWSLFWPMAIWQNRIERN